MFEQPDGILRRPRVPSWIEMFPHLWPEVRLGCHEHHRGLVFQDWHPLPLLHLLPLPFQHLQVQRRAHPERVERQVHREGLRKAGQKDHGSNSSPEDRLIRLRRHLPLLNISIVVIKLAFCHISKTCLVRCRSQEAGGPSTDPAYSLLDLDWSPRSEVALNLSLGVRKGPWLQMNRIRNGLLAITLDPANPHPRDQGQFALAKTGLSRLNGTNENRKGQRDRSEDELGVCDA